MDPKSGFAEQMPATIGRYQVQGSIGYGAMGAVYKAFDPLIKRTLAIKTIRLDIPRNSPQYKSFIERFYHEARISGTLSHPNIVTLFDIGEESGIPYLAMEFVEGETISSLIEKGVRFPPEKVIGLVSQAASAVDYAHSKGVIHRDIKPSNMILSEGDRLKVTDFGIAKLVDSDMTQAGTLLGTPSYMSPEQAMGDKLDGRSDIFSLGVCAFEMLSGEQPFPGTNVTSILYKLVHVDPIEPANLEMNGLVPQKWHEVFGRVLAKKPDDRYQNGAEFVQDLEYCLGSWFGAVGSEQGMSEATVVVNQADLDAAMAKPAAPAATTPASEEVTTAMRLPELKPAPPKAPAPPEDDSASMTMPPTPLPRGQREKTPTPASENDLPATVHMKAPSADDMRTVAIPTDMLTVPMPAAKKPESAAPPPPTLKAPVLEDTLQAKAPTIKGPAPVVPAAPPPTAKAPTPIPAAAPPPPTPVAAKAPAARSGISPLLLLGGAAAFFFLAVAIALLVWLRRGTGGTVEPTPAPVVEATPTPALATPPPLAAAAAGAIHVETSPPGASISVNGELKGTSPIDVPDLPVGNYEVKAELKGYEAKTETVTLVTGATAPSLTIALSRVAPTQGSVEVLSTPPGAALSVDGKFVGSTPISSLRLAPGPHRIELSADGHEPWSSSVTIEVGKRARVEAGLRAIVKATPMPPPRVESVDPSKIYTNSAGDVETLARKSSGPSAQYPNNAPRLKSGESVSMSVSFVVDENGDVQDPQITESAGKQIDDSVIQAIRKWKYTPAVKQGVKVKVKINFKQTFRAG